MLVEGRGVPGEQGGLPEGWLEPRPQRRLQEVVAECVCSGGFLPAASSEGGQREPSPPPPKFLKHLLGLVAGVGPLTIQKYLSHGSACGWQRRGSAAASAPALPPPPHRHRPRLPVLSEASADVHCR